MKNTSAYNILIIGSGRLACHLEHWVHLLPNFESTNPSDSKITVQKWSRSKNTKTELQQSLEKANYVWLAISDSAIESFYKTEILPSLSKSAVVVHFSGALNIEGLFAAHPLMTFGPELYTLEKYQQIHWAVTAPAELMTSLDSVATQKSTTNALLKLSDLLPHFRNPFFHLAAEHKALYHALCVVAGNIPQMMWSEVNQKMQSLEIPKEALHVYLKQVVENFNQFGSDAITGPLVRQDKNTIEKNLAALKQSSSYLEKIYQTTANAAEAHHHEKASLNKKAHPKDEASSTVTIKKDPL